MAKTVYAPLERRSEQLHDVAFSNAIYQARRKKGMAQVDVAFALRQAGQKFAACRLRTSQARKAA